MVVNLPANKNAPPTNMAADLSKIQDPGIQIPLLRFSRHCAGVSMGQGDTVHLGLTRRQY